MSKRFLFYSLFLIYGALAQAQESINHIYYQRETLEEGLPSNIIYRMNQDHDGLLWVCSDGGLFSYDGRSSKLYRIENNEDYTNDIIGVQIDYKNRPIALDFSLNTFLVSKDEIIDNAEDTSLPKMRNYALFLINEETFSLVTDGSQIYKLEGRTFTKVFDKDEPYLDHLRSFRKDGNTYKLVYKAGYTLTLSEDFGILEEFFDVESEQCLAHLAKDEAEVWSLETHLKVVHKGDNYIFTYPFLNESTTILYGGLHSVDSVVYGAVANHFFTIHFGEKPIVKWYKVNELAIISSLYVLEDHSIILSTLGDGFYMIRKEWLHGVDFSYKSYGSIHHFQQANNQDFIIQKDQIDVYSQGIFDREIEIAEDLYIRKIFYGASNYYAIGFYGLYRIPAQDFNKLIVIDDESLKKYKYLERGSLKDAVIWKDSLYITLASAFVKVALKTGEIDTINRIRSEKLFPFESCLFVNTAKSIVIYRDNYNADTLLNVSAKKVIETDDNCFLILTNGDNYIHYNCFDNKKRVVKHYGLPVFTDIYWKNGKVYGCNKSGIYQCSFQESELKILQKYTLENTYLTLKDADTKRTYIATDQFVQVIDLEHLFAQPEKLKVHKLYIHQWTGSRVGQTFRLDKTQNSFDFLIGDNHAASLRYLVVNNEDSVYYNTNNISLGYLKEGLSKFQVVGFDRFGNPSEPFVIKVSNLLPLAYSTRFLFGVLAVIMLVLFTTIYFYQRNNIRFIKLKSRNNEEEMRHKLVALSSQMKPHFIHNILNTAQYYMITEDIDRSNLVIAKLSAIIDEVLTATTQRDTTIEKVVDFLEQYCSLEQIRFENKFDYCIEVDQEVNVNQPIPYFFIQPLVENAIWHGLLKDNDNKNRQVRVHIKRAMDAIEVTVEDNGLGYKNAGDAHTSISIRNLNERINLLRKLNEWDIKLRIEQASSFARGTLCTVHFSRLN